MQGLVVGVGIDVAETSRFERLLLRGADRFWAHWFTEAEAESCRRQQRPGLAAASCFAVKEATFKAVGAEFSAAVRWRDIEILPSGQSWRVHLHGEVAATAANARIDYLHVSSCEATDWVMATVIAEMRIGQAQLT